MRGDIATMPAWTAPPEVWEADVAELKGLGIGYMPTAFPGFSVDNLRRTKPGTTMIARCKGEFYWRQFAIFRTLGIRTVFVGMFDEVNEATAIYKVSEEIPVGRYFVTYEGLPTRLVFEAHRRGHSNYSRRGAAVGKDSRDIDNSVQGGAITDLMRRFRGEFWKTICRGRSRWRASQRQGRP